MHVHVDSFVIFETGWGHFAQFTIAVANKDPKKSKFSGEFSSSNLLAPFSICRHLNSPLADTLHRFWKKEHDWGWKKFIESQKLNDGFVDDSDSLTIEAQVQVIR